MVYVLILLMQFNREDGMTAIPGFKSRAECESAGAAYVVEAKYNQVRLPRFFCFPAALSLDKRGEG